MKKAILGTDALAMAISSRYDNKTLCSACPSIFLNHCHNVHDLNNIPGE